RGQNTRSAPSAADFRRRADAGIRHAPRHVRISVGCTYGFSAHGAGPGVSTAGAARAGAGVPRLGPSARPLMVALAVVEPDRAHPTRAIRWAVPEDRGAIVAFCRSTWGAEGSDYIE